MVSRKSFPGVLEAVRGSDALVVGGGSLLQDVTSFRSLAYYVSILRWALFWGKPILFYGCGLGPLRRFLSRFMVSQVLRRSFLILRDEESQDLALRLRASPSQVFLGADPVFALGDLEGRRQSGSRKVAVFLRPVDGWPEEVLFESLRAIVPQVPHMELVAFHRERDGSVVDRFARELGVPGVFFEGVEELLRYFEEVEMVLSFRLHPLILATLFGIPWVAFDVDPKIRALAALSGGENLLAPGAIGAETLGRLYEERYRFREKGAKVKELLLTRSRTMREYLLKCLDGLR